jgi:DNA repair protein RadC
MILLLTGASDIGRIALAEKIVKEQPQWKHLPMEQVEKIAETQGLPTGGENESIMLHIACHCAKEMQEEGFNTVLSYEEANEIIPELRSELGDTFVAISLGATKDHDLFDHIIDTSSQSINEAYAAIAKIIDTSQS